MLLCLGEWLSIFSPCLHHLSHLYYTRAPMVHSSPYSFSPILLKAATVIFWEHKSGHVPLPLKNLQGIPISLRMNSKFLPLHLQSPGIWALSHPSESQPHPLTRPTAATRDVFWNHHLHKSQKDLHGGPPLSQTCPQSIHPSTAHTPSRHCQYSTGSFSRSS